MDAPGAPPPPGPDDARLHAYTTNAKLQAFLRRIQEMNEHFHHTTQRWPMFPGLGPNYTGVWATQYTALDLDEDGDERENHAVFVVQVPGTANEFFVFNSNDDQGPTPDDGFQHAVGSLQGSIFHRPWQLRPTAFHSGPYMRERWFGGICGSISTCMHQWWNHLLTMYEPDIALKHIMAATTSPSAHGMDWVDFFNHMFEIGMGTPQFRFSAGRTFIPPHK